MLEWSVLALALLVFVGAFGYYAQRVQGNAERAAVQSALGALRTALVVGHLEEQLQRSALPTPPDRYNPFLLLQTVPVNYRGEMSVPQALAAKPGSWVFDPQCRCVGYVPLSKKWLESPPDAGILWFKVEGGPGPLQLIAMDRYVWQGLPVT